MLTEHGDGVASIKRRHHDLRSDGVSTLVTPSEHGRPKGTLDDSVDRGKARHSVSSTSAHHNYGSSSHHGDDDEDDGVSHASTPSPTTYLNFLRLLNYQRYDIPTSSQQDDDWKRISDKRTKSQAKTDKTEHGMEKRGKIKVNPDKVKAKKSSSQRKYNFRDQICQILKLYNKDKKLQGLKL
ncbi:hypothetical protein Tco_0855292 [Tanacetum coccineum]